VACRPYAKGSQHYNGQNECRLCKKVIRDETFNDCSSCKFHFRFDLANSIWLIRLHLANHTRGHTERRPFECEICHRVRTSCASSFACVLLIG